MAQAEEPANEETKAQMTPAKSRLWQANGQSVQPARGYWVFVGYDRASLNPRLLRVQDPFGNLLARARGSMVISASEIIASLVAAQE